MLAILRNMFDTGFTVVPGSIFGKEKLVEGKKESG